MVWIETWPIQFLLGSSSPPAAWHNLAQVLLSLPIPAFAAGNARLWPAFFWWANQEKMAACARRSQIGITRATAEVLVAGLAGAPCSTAASSIFVAPPDNFWMRRYPGVMCGLVSSPGAQNIGLRGDVHPDMQHIEPNAASSKVGETASACQYSI